MQSAKTLSAWASDVTARAQHAYLLIDSAQHEDSHLWLERRNIAYASLFDGKDQASLKSVAPLLIPLTGLDGELQEGVCKWALGLGVSAPCLSWVESALPLGELATQLGLFHTVGLSDGQVMLMRWYDTRIMPVWMACLEPAQRGQFTATLLTINFLDRFGNDTLLFSTQQVTAPLKSPEFGKQVIYLDDRQFAMLMNASDLDTLIKHLRRVITDETNLVPEKQLFEFVGKYLDIARAAGIDDLDRQTQVALLALYTSGKGIEHPRFQAILDHPPPGIDAFHAEMDQLPDEVWEAGPPVWGAAHQNAPFA